MVCSEHVVIANGDFGENGWILVDDFNFGGHLTIEVVGEVLDEQADAERETKRNAEDPGDLDGQGVVFAEDFGHAVEVGL